MPAAISLILLGVSIIATESSPLPQTANSPCPEIFRYDEVSDGEWKASVTLTSESDLHGVWVRLLTRPKLEDVVVSDDYQVKYNGTDEVRLANREFNLDANIPRSISLRGKLINGEIPELISVVLNGKLICSSEKLNGSALYNGDFNNKNYLSSVSKSENGSIDNSPKTNKCGKALLLNSLIPNDNIKVLPGDWPWQAAIFRDTVGNASLLCEATLISESALVTAAHCVTWENSKIPVSSSILTVRLKNLNVQEASEDEILKVKNIIIHPGFNEKSLLNDIAVIKLVQAVELDEATQPICLPDSGRLPDETFILGYGFKQDGALTNLGIAKTVPLSEDTCVKMEPSYQSLVNDNNICATYVQDHQVCVGSSGSGVMDVKSDSEYIWELRGVLSVGRALQDKFKCDQNSPVLIVDVSKYSKWIRATAY